MRKIIPFDEHLKGNKSGSETGVSKPGASGKGVGGEQGGATKLGAGNTGSQRNEPPQTPSDFERGAVKFVKALAKKEGITPAELLELGSGLDFVFLRSDTARKLRQIEEAAGLGKGEIAQSMLEGYIEQVMDPDELVANIRDGWPDLSTIEAARIALLADGWQKQYQERVQQQRRSA